MLGFVQDYLGNNPNRTPSITSVLSQGPINPNQPPEIPSSAGASQPAEAEALDVQQTAREKYTTVLILGRSGSGKSTFIDHAFSKPGRETNSKTYKPTIDAGSVRITTPKHKFRLIDTPGFDGLAVSNLDAFTKIAKYLLDEKTLESGITGVVYIHRAGDPLESGTLMQNMSVISDIFLGEIGLSRLSILVVPTKPGSSGSTAAAHALSRNTAFRTAYKNGAKILVSSFDSASINEVLLSYTTKAPILLHIQQGRPLDSLAALRAQIEERLGYYGKDSLHALVEDQVQRRLASYEDKIRTLEERLENSEESSFRNSNDGGQGDQQLREETIALRQQLQELQDKHSALHPQPSLQENIQLDDIVQALKDLNHEIEEIGRSVSAYLVGNYVQSILGKDAGDVTALHARRLPELASLFGHVEGNSSLISSSSGEGMPIEDFFDYAVRCLLCKYLCRRVFDPFHPGVDLSHSEVISFVYGNMRRQEPQVVAGKWRADCFRNIYRPTKADATSKHIKMISQKFYRDIVETLVSYFFGQKANVKLDEQHISRLERLVQTAWDWNSMLKSEVVVLGDFYQITYPPASRFDPKFMVDSQPSAQGIPPRSILGTLALGLVSSRAIGGERNPEVTVLSKAVIATKSLYT